MRSFNRKAATIAAATTLILAGSVTAYAINSNSESNPPASCEKPGAPSQARGGPPAAQAQFPKNSKGQTYGGPSPDGVGLPDLVQAVAEDGTTAYVSECDLNSDDSRDTLPMYDKEGNPNGKSFKRFGTKSEGGMGTVGDRQGPQLK